jgi:cell division septation protein DedD
MSTGLLTGRRRAPRVLVVACAAALLAAAAGCGDKGDQEDRAGPEPRAMVPAGAADSAGVDTSSALVNESAYVAGTISDAGSIREVPGSPDSPDQTAPAKVVPPSQIRPATSASTRGGDYNLQLGSFTNLDNARRQAERIRALGYAPVLEKSELGGQTYHRVILRGVGDMAEASRLGEVIHSKLGIAYLVRRAK